MFARFPRSAGADRRPHFAPLAALVLAGLACAGAAGPALAQAPTISNVFPPLATTMGGPRITIVGSNFAAAGGEVSIQGRTVVVPAGADWAPSRILLTLPAGDPGPAPIFVTTAGGLSSPVSNAFSYQAPQLFAITPSNGPAAGGALITLTGQNFGTGTAEGTAQFGASSVPLIHVSHNEVRAVAPPVAPGTTVPVAVTINGLTTGAQPYTADAPLIASFSPVTGPTAGGTTITIFGSNFGEAPDPTPVVKFGGIVSASVTRLGPGEVRALLPEGSGAGNPVELHVGGAQSPPAPVPFAYLPPAIFVVSPPSAPAVGGVRITLTGDNFGPPGTARELNLQPMGGGVVIHGALNGPESHTQLEADLPPVAPGNYALTLLVNGQVSPPVPYVATGLPVVGNVSPPGAPTQGGVLVTVTGQNFGAAGGTVLVQGRGVFVSPPAWSPSSIEFALPEGDPGPATIEVQPADGPGAQPFEGFAYLPPQLTFLSPAGGPAAGGTVITVHGVNFGTEAASRVARMGGKIALCTRLGHTELELVAPDLPPGLPVPVEITINGLPANPLPYQVAAAAPQILALSSPSGPTQGNVPITIIGQDFGAAPGIVRFGPFPAPVVDWSDTMIEAFTPEAWSGLFPVQVELPDGTPAANALPYEYAPPQLAFTSPSLLDPAGGQVITISGQDFGRSDAPRTVTIGGLPATPLAWFGHNALAVQSPPGVAGALVPLCMELPGVGPVCIDVQYGNPVGVATPAVPVAFGLRLAGPNPARGDVTFAVDLARDARFRLRVFDSAGRMVRAYEADAAAGTRLVRWDGADARGARAPAGLYWARLEVAGGKFVQKVLRL